MDSKHLRVSHEIEPSGAVIIEEKFVEKKDMSRGGMFDEIHSTYDDVTHQMTIEGEVSYTVSIDRARKAVEDAFRFASDVSQQARHT